MGIKLFSYIQKEKSLYKTVVFLILYLNVLFTFAVIYIFIDMTGLGFLNDHYAAPMHQQQSFDIITRSLYFSAITLLSVGYGDVTPFGLARGVAILEALIGYLLPVIIVIQFFPPRKDGEEESHYPD